MTTTKTTFRRINSSTSNGSVSVSLSDIALDLNARKRPSPFSTKVTAIAISNFDDTEEIREAKTVGPSALLVTASLAVTYRSQIICEMRKELEKKTLAAVKSLSAPRKRTNNVKKNTSRTGHQIEPERLSLLALPSDQIVKRLLNNCDANQSNLLAECRLDLDIKDQKSPCPNPNPNPNSGTPPTSSRIFSSFEFPLIDFASYGSNVIFDYNSFDYLPTIDSSRLLNETIELFLDEPLTQSMIQAWVGNSIDPDPDPGVIMETQDLFQEGVVTPMEIPQTRIDQLEQALSDTIIPSISEAFESRPMSVTTIEMNHITPLPVTNKQTVEKKKITKQSTRVSSATITDFISTVDCFITDLSTIVSYDRMSTAVKRRERSTLLVSSLEDKSNVENWSLHTDNIIDRVNNFLLTDFSPISNVFQLSHPSSLFQSSDGFLGSNTNRVHGMEIFPENLENDFQDMQPIEITSEIGEQKMLTDTSTSIENFEIVTNSLNCAEVALTRNDLLESELRTALKTQSRSDQSESTFEMTQIIGNLINLNEVTSLNEICERSNHSSQQNFVALLHFAHSINSGTDGEVLDKKWTKGKIRLVGDGSDVRIITV
ncbi:hypothetical protein RCL1_005108 [Eukaryota sp. TZLM3-RCL]